MGILSLILCSKSQKGFREKAPWVKCLLRKQNNLSLNPRSLCKEAGRSTGAACVLAWWGGRDGQVSEAHWSASLDQCMISGSARDSVSKTKRWKATEERHSVFTSDFYSQAYTNTSTHTHTRTPPKKNPKSCKACISFNRKSHFEELSSGKWTG